MLRNHFRSTSRLGRCLSAACLLTVFAAAPALSSVAVASHGSSARVAQASTGGASRDVLHHFPAVADNVPTRDVLHHFPVVADNVPTHDVLHHFPAFADNVPTRDVLHHFFC